MISAKLLLTLCILFLVPQDKRKAGNPLDHLPSNIEVLTHFGERADLSPDNKTVAFMAKSFGDAMTIDLDTRIIRCLTCNVPGAAFLRVMHLSNGDYLLIGPDHFENINISRSRDNELWYLSKKPGSKPVKLGQKMSEGAAVSKKNTTIAFAETRGADLPDGASRIITAWLDLTGPEPKLMNKKVVYESKDRNCVLEAQDFYDNDTKLTFTCYEPNNLASVWSIELHSKKVTNLSNAPGNYNEVEGIFPGGGEQYTCVESDHQCDWLGGDRGPGNIDIWKLKMDGTGKNFTRLTNFNDYEGSKASNPV